LPVALSGMLSPSRKPFCELVCATKLSSTID